jgi:hypothetical protein
MTPATRSLLVKVSGFGASFWRRAHAAMLQADATGRYVDPVWASRPGRYEIARVSRCGTAAAVQPQRCRLSATGRQAGPVRDCHG